MSLLVFKAYQFISPCCYYFSPLTIPSSFRVVLQIPSILVIGCHITYYAKTYQLKTTNVYYPRICGSGAASVTALQLKSVVRSRPGLCKAWPGWEEAFSGWFNRMALAGASIPCHRASLWLLGCPHATAAGFPWSKMREGGIGEEKGRQSGSCSVFMNSCTPSLPHCPVGHPVMLRRRQRGRGQNIGRGGPLRPVWERAAPQPWKVSFHLTVHLPFPVRGRYVRQRLSLVFSLKGQISHKA